MTSPPPFTPDVESAGRVLADWVKRMYYWRAFVLSDVVPEGELVCWHPEAMT